MLVVLGNFEILPETFLAIKSAYHQVSGYRKVIVLLWVVPENSDVLGVKFEGSVMD